MSDYRSSWRDVAGGPSQAVEVEELTDQSDLYPTSIDAKKILVVEDEAAIADFLKRGLEAEGYAVLIAGDGLEGERLALDPGRRPGGPRPDAPPARRDRGAGRDPRRQAGPAGDPADRPAAGRRPRRGARPRRHRLHDQALLLRGASGPDQGPPARARQRAAATLEAAGIRLDLLARGPSATACRYDWPSAEAELLAHLMRHAGRVCTRSEILVAVWGYDHDPRYQRRPGLYRLPAPQACPARLPGADRDRALGRLPAGRAGMRGSWLRLGLRGRLALSIAAIVVVAFGVLFVSVHRRWRRSRR